MLKSNYARFDSQIKAMYRDQKGPGWRQGGRVRVEGMEGGPEWDNLPVDLTVTVEGGRQGEGMGWKFGETYWDSRKKSFQGVKFEPLW